jgi:hypothetical protein
VIVPTRITNTARITDKNSRCARLIAVPSLNI